MSIKLRLSAFEDGRFEARHEIAPEAIGLNTPDDPMRIDGPIRVSLEAKMASAGDVIVLADIRATFAQECVRCLDEIRKDRKEQLSMLFCRESDRERRETSGEAESPDLGYYVGDEIDLDEEISGFLLQVADEYPLCRKDCKGLDPATGENLNHRSAIRSEKAGKKPGAEKAEPEWKKKLRGLGEG
jgi:uncharacterized metal-binding protein YceD (DUF177 family)